MRRLIGIALLLAFAVGLVLSGRRDDKMPAPSAQVRDTADPQNRERICVEIVRPAAASAETAVVQTEPVILNVCDEGRMERVALEDYLVSVLAGEMPVSYPMEALKAQAIAARSYIVWKLPRFGGSGCSRGAQADVCTDSKHCMAYRSDAQMREGWGESYEEKHEKLLRAVQETAGQILLYDGRPAQALFHAASGGRTEDAQEVWGTAYPYLQSVESEGEQGQTAQVRLSKSKLAQKLNAAFEGAGLTAANIERQFSIRSVTGSGRADAVRVGRVTATGKAVRAALGLRSAGFTIAFEGDDAILTTNGFGHGVGLSQEGAQNMAENGADCEEILLHYYTGVTIGSIQEISGA